MLSLRSSLYTSPTVSPLLDRTMDTHALLVFETLYGVGHAQRIAHLSQSLGRAGVRTTIAASKASLRRGDMFDYGSAELVGLPTFLPDENGRYCLTDNGIPYQVDRDFQRRRTHALLGVTRNSPPDCIVTETYPFGRGYLHAEM